jgi:hypothetical protein
MGLGPPVFALYRQLKALQVFDDVKSVMELGSQNVWCPHGNMIKDIFAAFGRSAPSPQLLESFANWTGAARDFYEGLGLEYQCVDTDAKFGALTLDINFDAVPPEHRGRYDFVTNHGTTEHLINQLNAFRMMHDFTKPGGYMLHALPFLGQVDHGFFNYQPNLFDSLARYNSYRTLGMWVGVDWQLSSFIPWDPKLLDFLALSPRSTGLLIVLHQKMYDAEFQVPFQGVYEATKTEDVSSRYCFVVDGEYYDGRRDKFLTKEPMQAAYLQEQIAKQVEAHVQQHINLAVPNEEQLFRAGGRALARALLKRIRRRLLGIN